MADISAITALDGVTYSIKDSEAREHLVPTGGTTGQVLTKTASGEAWQTPSVGGNVDTVNSIQPDANKNVQTVVELTQAQYDALVSPDPNVVYYITDGSTAYPTADDVRYEEGVSVADALDTLNDGITVQFLSTGWTGSETVGGIAYVTQTVSVTHVSGHPIVGIVPISGTLPTSAEQGAFDSVSYFTADSTSHTVKGYAKTAPTDTFAVVVKGAS